MLWHYCCLWDFKSFALHRLSLSTFHVLQRGYLQHVPNVDHKSSWNRVRPNPLSSLIFHLQARGNMLGWFQNLDFQHLIVRHMQLQGR